MKCILTNKRGFIDMIKPTFWVESEMIWLGRAQCHHHCLSLISVAMTKHHDKKQLMEGRLYLALSARLEFITVGKPRQDLQMASHITPTAKKRGKSTCLRTCGLHAACLSTLTQLRTLCLGNRAAHSELALTKSLTLVETSFHRHAYSPI